MRWDVQYNNDSQNRAQEHSNRVLSISLVIPQQLGLQIRYQVTMFPHLAVQRATRSQIYALQDQICHRDAQRLWALLWG